MTYEEVLQNARKNMSPMCKVCPECNGIACKGEIPGMGAKGDGRSFTECREYLKSIKINMDTIYEFNGQDTQISMFGKNYEYPFFVAPIGGMKLNIGGYLSESEYCKAVSEGAKMSGIAAFVGDAPSDEVFNAGLPYVKNCGAIPTIKPWQKDKLFSRIKQLEEIGATAIAMDIDAYGLVDISKVGNLFFVKTAQELKEAISSTKLPFILKGIMTPEGAEKAAYAGAYGIVISTHGGRVTPDAPATCSVIEDIRKAVGDKLKIFVDGGIRNGGDVFKAIALGADAVLIGRPFTIAAFGGGAEGVHILSEKIGKELKEAMLMSGCSNISDICRKKINF